MFLVFAQNNNYLQKHMKGTNEYLDLATTSLYWGFEKVHCCSKTRNDPNAQVFYFRCSVPQLAPNSSEEVYIYLY